MNITTRTPTSRSASEWADLCGLDEETMHILLLSMPTNTVIETSEGQWSLTPQFFAKFARAFGDIALELDSDHDDEPGTGGRVSIENDMLTLPRPAQFSRARRRN